MKLVGKPVLLVSKGTWLTNPPEPGLGCDLACFSRAAYSGVYTFRLLYGQVSGHDSPAIT
jgi:hypothetical protein